MEVLLQEVAGVPPDAILSLKVGGTRRQAPVAAAGQPYRFSVSPAESDTEQEVVNNTQARWNFDCGEDVEKCRPQCQRTTSSTSCGSQESTAYCSSSDEMDTPHTLNSGVWPSMGSVGHPHMCAAPCKFAGKNSCKDGESCTRCHICIWTRAKYRERAGAHRTLEMMSV